MSTLLDVPPHHRDDDSGQAAAMYDVLESRITADAVREWLLDICDEVSPWAGVEIDAPLEHLPAAQEILKSLVIKDSLNRARQHLLYGLDALDEIAEEFDVWDCAAVTDEIQQAAEILGMEKL